jgi:hypothetical protein
VDVRDVKNRKVSYLSSVLCLVPLLEILPNHWKMSGGHSQGPGEGHGAHPDRVGAADMMAMKAAIFSAPAILSKLTHLAHFYSETLKESREQKKWRPLCREVERL